MQLRIGAPLLGALLSALGLLSAIECNSLRQIAQLQQRHQRSPSHLEAHSKQLKESLGLRHFRRDVDINEANEEDTGTLKPFEHESRALFSAQDEVPFYLLPASEADPALVEEILKSALALGDDSLRYTKATIEQPVKMIQLLSQIQKDIAWGMFGENYMGRHVNNLGPFWA